MKTFLKYLVGTTGLALSIGAMGRMTAVMPGGPRRRPAQDNRGHVLCTAAINSDGTKAGGNTVASSTRLRLGQYQVTFKAPCTTVTATNGWMRVVQVDTLTTGALPAISCTTADRSGRRMPSLFSAITIPAYRLTLRSSCSWRGDTLSRSPLRAQPLASSDCAERLAEYVEAFARQLRESPDRLNVQRPRPQSVSKRLS